MSARDFWLSIHGPRVADFERVYGTTCVAVRSPAPHMAILPGFDSPQPVYELDLDWLAEIGRREQLVDFIAERFGQSREFVSEHLESEGVPILAGDTTLRIDNPQRWFDDDDSGEPCHDEWNPYDDGIAY